MTAALRSLGPLALMAVAAAGGLMLARTNTAGPPEESLASLRGSGPRVRIHLSQDDFRGDPNAKIVMVEYSDFQCPFCIKFATTLLPRLERDYVKPGLVRVAFRNYPLVSLHPEAMPAAELLECARRQHRSWEIHDALFKAAGKLGDSVFADIARRSGLDDAATRACLQGDARRQVETEVKEATGLGINSTPTVLLGLAEADDNLTVFYTLTGAKSEGTVRRALDDLVLETSSRKRQ